MCGFSDELALPEAADDVQVDECAIKGLQDIASSLSPALHGNRSVDQF